MMLDFLFLTETTIKTFQIRNINKECFPSTTDLNFQTPKHEMLFWYQMNKSADA